MPDEASPNAGKLADDEGLRLASTRVRVGVLIGMAGSAMRTNVPPASTPEARQPATSWPKVLPEPSHGLELVGDLVGDLAGVVRAVASEGREPTPQGLPARDANEKPVSAGLIGLLKGSWETRRR